MLSKIANSKMKKATCIALAAGISFGAAAFLTSDANAADPHKLNVSKNDVFSSQDEKRKPSHKKIQNIGNAPNAVAAAGRFAMDSADSPEKRWFETVDEAVVKYRKTLQEKTILAKDFNSEIERIQEWIRTANEVSTRYKILAKLIRDTKAPNNDLVFYQRNLADYYSDSASIYDDLIKPRKPSNTIEDLKEELARIASKSESVKRNWDNLQLLDVSLRGQYRVHRRTADDAFQQYIYNR